MSGTEYALLAYAVSVLLLGGYALNLYLIARQIRRRETHRQ